MIHHNTGTFFTQNFYHGFDSLRRISVLVSFFDAQIYVISKVGHENKEYIHRFLDFRKSPSTCLIRRGTKDFTYLIGAKRVAGLRPIRVDLWDPRG